MYYIMMWGRREERDGIYIYLSLSLCLPLYLSVKSDLVLCTVFLVSVCTCLCMSVCVCVCHGCLYLSLLYELFLMALANNIDNNYNMVGFLMIC